MDTSGTLIRMANDIGNFFRAQAREDAIAGIKNHIVSFWTRRMREKLIAEGLHDGSGLDELPREAVLRLAGPGSDKPRQAPGGDAG